MIKTRFAPSPTGFLHVGGLRSALFAYLFARKNDGKFLLRIEDTDRERFVEGGMENIISSLKWAGIEIDEGAKMNDAGEIIQVGENGPYIQSERLEIYKKYVDQLIELGCAYYCFCTKERLDEVRKIQQLNKQATGYDGHCRDISLDEAKKKIEAGESYVVRMKMPHEGTTTVKDQIRGEVEFENKLVDDQVLLKSDGFPTYHMAVVVDDHLMEITHVIRGEEWLPSTPKHVNLYKMLGWDVPEYAHLPLLVNEKKQKLSKRHGDVSVRDFIEKGYIKEALVNFIAFLGWNPGDEREIFSMDELEKEFTMEKVGSSASVFNLEKLDWYNKQYLSKIDSSKLVELAMPFFVNAGIISLKSKVISLKSLEKIVNLERERITKLVDLPEAVGFVFADSLEYDTELLIWKKADQADAKAKLTELEGVLSTVDNWSLENLETKIGEWIKTKEYDVGNVLWPMRVVLSGQKNSPGPYEIADALGKEKTLKRIKEGINKL